MQRENLKNLTYQTKTSKVQNGKTNSVSLVLFISFEAFHNFIPKNKRDPPGHEAQHVHTSKQMSFICWATLFNWLNASPYSKTFSNVLMFYDTAAAPLTKQRGKQDLFHLTTCHCSTWASHLESKQPTARQSTTSPKGGRSALRRDIKLLWQLLWQCGMLFFWDCSRSDTYFYTGHDFT